MSENPRQFTSLDYADADMYGALTSKPPTATPLNLPLDDLSGKKPSGNISPGEAAHYRDEETRRRSLFLEQQEAQASREAALKEREVARNLALQKTRSTELEQPTVSSRDYEKRFELPKSTLERQPLPSTGSPPPTLNGTAARASALVEPTATPAPAALKEAIATTAGNAISALPRALPQAAGRLVIPGVGAALSVGTRLVVGQSVTQAVTSTGAGLIGSGIGAIVGTAIAGPVGGIVGGMIGGTAASLFSDWLFAQNLPKATTHLETFTPNYPPFVGAQQTGGAYYLTLTYTIDYGGGVTKTFSDTGQVFSPIGSPSVITDPTHGTGYQVAVHDFAGNPDIAYYGRGGGGTAAGIRDIQLAFIYGNPDNGQNIVQPIPPQDNTPYRYNTSPIGNDNTIASGLPAAGINKGVTKNVAPSMPSNNTPNGAPFFPGHGGLAPSYLPNPEHQPSNLGGMLPAIKNAPQPLPFAEPEDVAIPREGNATTTAINPSTFGFPAYIPQIAQPIPINDGLSPVPKVKTSPIVKTPTEAALDQQKKDFDEQVKRITAIAGILAGLTPIVQGIPDAIANNPNVRAANREDVQGAVCKIAQPGKCLGKAIDDSANKVNQNNNQNTANLLDKINAGANAAQLALLELINTKLGDLLPGGLSGTFTRLWQTLQVDRILNILILITTFHNALMLSNNLTQTLFAAIDNISQAVGFKWKNEKGEESGFGSIASEWTANFFKSIFGEANYAELVAEYKKANRIYQATANIFNALQSIGYSILSALEVVGSYVALIGNALRKWGEVGESAYKWFNPQPNFHNKFFTTLEGATNVVSQIDQVASEVVSVEQNVAQIGELKNELGKSMGEEDGSKQGVQPPEATKVKAGFDASKLVSATGIAIADSDKEADE